MNKKILKALSLLLLLTLLVSACGTSTPTEEIMATEETDDTSEEPAPTDEAAEDLEEVTLTIGFTASLTGRLNVSSTRQNNGFNLWMEDVNSAGGIQVGNQLVTFDSVFYDDESTKERVQELYTRLATEDAVDFLISPYSSGLTGAAALIAEQYGLVMITTGAASDSAYHLGYTSVYQTYTPASRYLTGAIDHMLETDPDISRVAFVHENDTFSTDVVTAAVEYAESLGLEIVLFESYDSETADFGPFINKIEAAEPQALLGGGHFQDGSTFARQLYEKGLEIGYVALLVAPPEPDFAELGDAAFGIIGPSQWEPLAEFTPDSAEDAGLEWFGPSGSQFYNGYVGAYDEEPSYHSAGGYAAGLILQKALMDAGSADPDAVRAALDNMNILTFFGRIQFDTSAEAHGLQIGHSMIYIQWQGEGEMAKQVVWPPEGATAETVYPIH